MTFEIIVDDSNGKILPFHRVIVSVASFSFLLPTNHKDVLIFEKTGIDMPGGVALHADEKEMSRWLCGWVPLWTVLVVICK